MADPRPAPADLALCAHDLRGILTVIAGYSALLRRADLSATERDAAHSGIDAAIARADELVGDTIAGRVGAHRKHDTADTGAIADQSVADARVATGRDVQVQLRTTSAVNVDPVTLARVMENLLSNAAKYAAEGPIDVSVSVEGRVAVIEVADCGPGIPDAEKSTVFEPFVRLERDDGSPGTGLGLVVVKNVIESSGGSAIVLDRPGGGTVVRLELPLS
ncbi:MAG: HAMP domain-containing sensor histidine kinase [Coriobacteriia bacterium]|nr:HAMP domain-containing sensor histidine kinase [Coriobacteriia bacterium]